MLRLLLQVSLRNLFRSRINLLIGAIIFFGTLLLVVGGALLDSLVGSMSRSIIGSVAGHIQVYSVTSQRPDVHLAHHGQRAGPRARCRTSSASRGPSPSCRT